MKWKKFVRPPKKKGVPDVPVDDVLEQEDEIVPGRKDGDLVFCECGKEAHTGSHQCWGCAHRA